MTDARVLDAIGLGDMAPAMARMHGTYTPPASRSATGSITYTNGTTQNFTGANTVLTVYGDTSKVQKDFIDGVPQGYEVYFLPATLVIQGLGGFGAANVFVNETLGGGLEFVQYPPKLNHLSQTITVQLPQEYNLQTDLTSGMAFSTNYFNMGFIQTTAGQISFINTTGTGFMFARLNK